MSSDASSIAASVVCPSTSSQISSDHAVDVEWRIYPPNSPCYTHGDEVFIRPKSNKEMGKYGKVLLQDQQHISNSDSNNNKDKNNYKNRIPVEIISSRKSHVSNEDSNRDNDNKDDSASNEKEKIQSQNSYQTSFRPVRLIQRYQPNRNQQQQQQQKCTILITAKTNHYRNLGSSQLNQSDHVLEIGCSNGECSLIITKYCKKFVGYDTSSQMISQAMDKMKNISTTSNASTKTTTATATATANNNHDNFKFYTIDPFMDPKKAIQNAQNPNVILIDIGGNRDLTSVLRMIQWSRSSFESSLHLIIVKSEQMVDCIMKKSLYSSSSSCSKLDDHDDNNNNTDNNDNNDDKSINNNDDNNSSNNGSKTDRKKRKLNHDTSSTIIKIDDTAGLITNGETWFKQSLQETYCKDEDNNNIIRDSSTNINTTTNANKGPPKYSHPLKAPMSLSPSDDNDSSNGDDVTPAGTPICRYYNYHKNGCKKHDCEFDHSHCHWCLQKGHNALNCPLGQS